MSGNIQNMIIVYLLVMDGEKGKKKLKKIEEKGTKGTHNTTYAILF